MMAGFDQFGNPDGGDDRRTGVQGYMLLIGAQDDQANGLKFMTPPPARSKDFPNQPDQPVFVPIRSWAAKLDRRFADVTSSCHYSPDHDLVFTASIPTGLRMEIRIDGVFHLDSIPQSLLIGIYDATALSHVILGFDDNNPFFEGDCQIANFIATTPIDDVVSYSCVLKPYGVFSAFPKPLS